MTVLSQAPNLAAVPTDRPDRCHALKGDRKGQFAVDIVNPHRLVFRPISSKEKQGPNESIDLNLVTAIEILGVEDYH